MKTTKSNTTRAAVSGFSTVEVSAVKQYGKEEFYPENETARTFTTLLRQKVLTKDDITAIKILGFRVMLKGGEL